MSKKPADRDRRIVADMLARARTAMSEIENWPQDRLDSLAQAIGWYAGNEATFSRLARMGVDESGIGDRDGRPAKRFKIQGVLRDVLRQKSTGIIEEDPVRGIVKYAKPAGVIASLIPMTNPALTPPVTAIFAAKARDAVIFSPHPRTAGTTGEMVEMLRAAARAAGAPRDLFQVIAKPSIPLTQHLMETCDLVMATGGRPMVRAAYSSGRPAYGVGAGNSTIVIDDTADIGTTAANIRMSKTSDFGSGCSADGNIIIQRSVYDETVKALVAEGGYLCNENEKRLLEKAMWNSDGNRTFSTIACPPQQTALEAGFAIPGDRRFLMVDNHGKTGKEHRFSGEKLTTVMALYRFETFDGAIATVLRILANGGKGHSCGIYSHDDQRINALALKVPVSRIMVRQPQSKSNAGSFTNGMPMTSSLGCGIWGGNITNENISLKHFMNHTWVSRPIPEDRPAEQELFGKFFGQKVE